MGILTTAVSITNRIGIFDLYGLLRRRFSGSQTAILLYHRVGPKNDNWSLSPLPPQVFKQQIEYFCKQYKIVSLDEVAQYFQQGKPLPEKALAITFDDGYKDNYTYAYPILNQFNIPATIFLATGRISSDELYWWDKVGYMLQNTKETKVYLNKLGNYSLASAKDKLLSQARITKALKKVTEDQKNKLIQELMILTKTHISGDLAKNLILSWDEIKEMSRNGIVFGSHTVNHPILTNTSLETAQQEIMESKLEIEKRLEKRVDLFSYPNGNYNGKIAEIVKNAGYTCAVSVTPNKLLNIKDDISALCRMNAPKDLSILKLELSGLLGDLQRLM